MADFSAAQARISARRRSRDATQASLAVARPAPLHHPLVLALPPSLRQLVMQTAGSFCSFSSAPYWSRTSSRAGQVDAELLDEELISLLASQATHGFAYLGAHLQNDRGLEIALLLRAVLWKLSIWDHGASYGATLQGLQYVDARHSNTDTRKPPTAWQRIAYGLLTVGGRYAWKRWEDHLSHQENGYEEPSPTIQRLSRVTTFLTTTHDVTAFVSFLVFLYNGKYRTLTDRILRLRLVPSSNQTSREVSFEYLNRQLVWHAFTEFLLFLLPLVGISRWRRWISRAWKKAKASITKIRTGNAAAAEDAEDIQQKGELGFLPERTCAICYQDHNPTGGAQSEQEVISAGANAGIIGNASTDITNPYSATPCDCIYCYVCLAQRIEAGEGEGWFCLRCGELIKECRPWDGDVIAPVHSVDNHGDRPSSRKSIAWADELVEDTATDQEPALLERTLSHVDPVPVEDDIEQQAEGSFLEDDC
jgi:peroxin-2